MISLIFLSLRAYFILNTISAIIIPSIGTKVIVSLNPTIDDDATTFGSILLIASLSPSMKLPSIASMVLLLSLILNILSATDAIITAIPLASLTTKVCMEKITDSSLLLFLISP